MKVVCGRCASEVEMPRDPASRDITCPSCGAVFRLPSLAEGEELPHPDTFPGYRLVAIIGHGGMGTVYRAVQLSMDRDVAIKVLLRKYAHVPRFVARFEREAMALAALNHPNIVAVIDRGKVEETYYFVMEYVRGHTLRRFIRTRGLSAERCVEVAIQVCLALEAAHGAGVVHRDIKPGNVLIQEDGVAKVADFGIAQLLDEEESESERRARLGTAKYMAPEQKSPGAGIDPRADLYALGVTLHEMLVGSLPEERPARPIAPHVPPELDVVCQRALQPEREERFASAAEMRQALEQALAALRRPPEVPPGAPVLEARACPTCEQPAPAEALRCPHCDALLAEPCFRPDCDGVNPVGAERCATCNGHIELLKRRRRRDLQRLLDRARAQAEVGETGRALADYRAVAAAPHEAFAELRQEAEQAARRLAHERRQAALRLVLHTVAALLLIAAAGAASYWGVRRLAARWGRRERVEERQAPPHSATPSRSTTAEPADPAPPRPAAPRRDPFHDYLLALTDGGWQDHAAALRIVVAAEAVRCLHEPPAESPEARRLATALAELRRGNIPPPRSDLLHAHMDRTLDALVHHLAAELRRYPALLTPVRNLLQQHAEQRAQARSSLRRLAIAGDTLGSLLTAAETALDPRPEIRERLLLLDAAVDPPASRDGLHPVADRLVRAGRLLLCHLHRRKRAQAAPELLHDARRRLDRAQAAPEPDARVAYGLEAWLEALAARHAVD